MLSLDNASDDKLVNRPKITVFVTFYKNQGVLWGSFIFRTTKP